MTEKSTKKKWLSVSMIVTVIFVGVMGMKWLKDHGPQPRKEPPVQAVPAVRVVPVHFQDDVNKGFRHLHGYVRVMVNFLAVEIAPAY